MSFEFEWDDAKAKANLKKHGARLRVRHPSARR